MRTWLSSQYPIEDDHSLINTEIRQALKVEDDILMEVNAVGFGRTCNQIIHTLRGAMED